MSLSPPKPTAAPDDWRQLLGLNLYRLLLVILLQIILQLGVVERFFATPQLHLFAETALGYAVFALLVLLPAVYRRPRLQVQALLNLLLDTGAVCLLMVAAGGAGSGMGMLLVPSALMASVLLNLRLAQLASLLAAFALGLTELWRTWPGLGDSVEYTRLGILTLLLVGTASAASTVAARARRSEARALAADTEFADLAGLNQTVLETMITGVVVIDSQDCIRSINQAALQLLHARTALIGQPLASTSALLHGALQRWRDGSALMEEPIPLADAEGSELLPRFRRLSNRPLAPVLLLIEDASRVREQAQQIKLASLGRLSASIAHEIRNPLSAIQQAAQLLAESTDLPATDRRLIRIVERHAKRMDVIIKDVMNLSRGAANPSVFLLQHWLTRTLAQYAEAWPERHVELQAPPELYARFDANHLQQVVFNLLDNAFTHAARPEAPASVRLVAYRAYLQGGALEVQDNGPGIAPEIATHLFEPFFTTRVNGTGLGLYLARELCAYNQAKLTLHQREGGGAVFRITFVAPDAPLP